VLEFLSRRLSLIQFRNSGSSSKLKKENPNVKEPLWDAVHLDLFHGDKKVREHSSAGRSSSALPFRHRITRSSA
jgi:hypothetical protein